jgi:hypothetical protein
MRERKFGGSCFSKLQQFQINRLDQDLLKEVETNLDSSDLRKKLMRRLIWKLPLIIALVSFAVWWQLKHNTDRGGGKDSAVVNSQLFAMLAGSWAAEVIYSSGERHREQFFFQPEADKIYGTATFLGIKRGIEDGKIAGAQLSFAVRVEEVVDQVVRERQLRYEMKLAGKELHVTLFDDRGSPPVQFRLVKTEESSGGSAPPSR